MLWSECTCIQHGEKQAQIFYQLRNSHTEFKEIICREQRETLSTNKGRFCNNSEIYTLISKRLSVENKAKLSQLTNLVDISRNEHPKFRYNLFWNLANCKRILLLKIQQWCTDIELLLPYILYIWVFTVQYIYLFRSLMLIGCSLKRLKVTLRDKLKKKATMVLGWKITRSSGPCMTMKW